MNDIRNWYKLLEGTGLTANDSGPGGAHGTLAANVTWLDYVFIYPDGLTLTGDLDPDATGIYLWTGTYNNRAYLTLNTSWFCWWDSAGGRWVISTELGVEGADFYDGGAVSPLGLYLAGGGASGQAMMTGDALEDFKGVTLTASESRIVTPAAAGFPPDAGSIEMMVRPRWDYNDGVSHFFWDTYGGSNRRFLLHKPADNSTALSTDNISRGSFTYQWTAETLYHIVMNWGANTLYINNILVKTFTAAGLGLGASTLYIGDALTGGNFSFSGDIFYFIVRDVPLTQTEIVAFNAFFRNLYIAHQD